MSQLYASGGQSIRASASASVLPMKIQGSFKLFRTFKKFLSSAPTITKVSVQNSEPSPWTC